MNQLKAMAIFAAVAKQGSMSAVARELGVANSVISKNINELESWLGRKLLYRSTRSLSLTQEGKDYLDKMQQILDQVSELESPASIENKNLTGRVLIAAPVFLGTKLIGPLLKEFHQEYPGIQIKLVLNNLFNDLVDEGFDIALRVSRLPDSNFIAKKLNEISLKLVASPRYIEKHGVPHSPDSLNRHNCLIDSSIANAHRWHFKDLKPKSNNKVQTIAINGPFEVNSGEMTADLCESDLGIAQLPDFFVNEAIQKGDLVEILPEYSIDDFYLSLIYHAQGKRNPINKIVIDFLSAGLKEG
ncbi:MAG: LysR family transcriptional regulator [Oleispira sp.]